MANPHEKLVTVASFQFAVEAELARNQLKEAGIPCVLTNQNVVSTLWSISNAVGGIQLQVLEHQAAEAERVLNESIRHGETEPIDESFDEFGEDEEDEEDEEPDVYPKHSLSMHQSIKSEDPKESRREQNANRLVKAALFGLCFPPLELYAIWLLLVVTFSKERIRPSYIRNATAGGCIIAFVALMLVILFCTH